MIVSTLCTQPPRHFASDTVTLKRVRDALRVGLRAEVASGEGFEVNASPLPLSEAILDDLEAVLGEHASPSLGEVNELAARLHLALRRLLTIIRPSASLDQLSRSLLVERTPPGEAEALAYLRRLAIVVLDLADQFMRSNASRPHAGRHRRSP